jgi:hypothetical protein
MTSAEKWVLDVKFLEITMTELLSDSELYSVCQDLRVFYISGGPLKVFCTPYFLQLENLYQQK